MSRGHACRPPTGVGAWVICAAAAILIGSCNSTQVGNPADTGVVYVEEGSTCGVGSPQCPMGTISQALEVPYEGRLQVVIAGGTYREAVRVARDVVLRGWRLSDKPVIRAVDDITVQVQGPVGVEVHHVLIEGADDPEALFGLAADDASVVELRGVELRGFADGAVAVLDADVRLIDSLVESGAGLVTFAATSRLTVTDSRVHEAVGRGVTVGGGEVTLTGGSITGTIATVDDTRGFGDGIVVFPDRPSTVTVQGVSVAANERSGVVSSDVEGRIEVADCDIFGNAGPAIWLEGPEGSAAGEPVSVVRGNRLADNRLAGISVQGLFAARLDDNSVESTGVYARADNRLGGDGIAVVNGGRVVGQDNVVAGNVRAGLVGSAASGRLEGLTSSANDFGLVLQFPPDDDPLVVVDDTLVDNTIGRLDDPAPEDALDVDFGAFREP